MIAFLFPGQGAQQVGMGKALADAYPEARAVFAEADATFDAQAAARVAGSTEARSLSRTERATAKTKPRARNATSTR